MSTPHRYWRVNITAYTNYPSIAELEFAPLGGTKRTGTPIESGHYDATQLPANAFDGNFATSWGPSSTTLPQWLGLDLGTAQGVDVVRIAGRNNGQAVTGFQVQSSDDGSSWTTEWTVTGSPNNNLLNSYPRPGQGKVLWKVAVTAVDGGAVWSASEIEMRETRGGTDHTAPGGHIFGAISGGLPWANAVDDNAATIFQAAGTAGEFYYEFAAAKAIVEVAMTARTDIHGDQSPKNFTIQSSPDNQTWTTEATFTDANAWAISEQRAFYFGAALPRPALPADLLGLFIDDVSTVTLVSGKVSQWGDLSGLNNHYAQSNAAKRPAPDATGINGHPSIRFVEANLTQLELPDIFNGKAAVAAIIVCKLDADPLGGDGWGALWRNDSTSSPYFTAAGTLYEGYGSGSRYNVAFSAFNLASRARFYGIRSKANDYKVIMNHRTLISQGAGHTVGRNTVPRIGHNNSDAGLDGQIVFYMALGRDFTDAEWGQWRDYVNMRYNLGIQMSGYTPLDPPADPVGAETGTTSELTSTSTGTSNTFAASAGAALVGSYGYRASFGGTAAKAMGELDFSPQTDNTYTEKLRLNPGFSLAADGDKITVLELLDASATQVVAVQIRKNSAKTGGYEVAVVHAAQTDVMTDGVALNTVIDIKVRYTANAGAGKLEALVNGGVISSKHALSNVTATIAKLKFGVTDPPGDPDDPPGSGGSGDYDDVGVGDPAVATAVAVTPATGTLRVGRTLDLAGLVLDVDGDPMPAETINWTVDNPALASLAGATGASNTVTALAEGTATISGTNGVHSDSAVITILPAPTLSRRSGRRPASKLMRGLLGF